MENIIKKITKNIFIFPILLVMLTLIIGVSFAYYQISLEGRKEISITIDGGINFTYSWTNEDYSLDSSKVMSDDLGKKQDTYYEFSVSSTVTIPKNINYLIYIEEISSTIDNSNVVMYLTDNDDNMLRKPTLVSALPIYNEDNTYKLFVNGFEFAKEGIKTHNYRLRSWISENSTIEGEYKYKVNVVMTDDEKSILDQEGVYITSARYLSDVSVDESLCEIESAYSNKFSTNIELDNDNSSITYEVTIYNSYNYDYYLSEVIKDNYTNENILYKLEGISLNDKIASKSTKTFTITFYYDVNASDIKTLSADLLFKFKMSSYVVATYAYKGSYEEFITPHDGIYKIELWGASGGDDASFTITAQTGSFDFTNRLVTFEGGYGGYTSGNISLNNSQKLYIYVGEMGKRNLLPTFNGGGSGAIGGTGYNGDAILEGVAVQSGNSGGGATDIRLTEGLWNDFDSLKSRIMVAGGGGGSTVETYSTAGGVSYAGGLNGYSGGYFQNHTYASQNGQGGTQISGGLAATIHFNATGTTTSGSFGIGGKTTSISSQTGAGGGGGGYYGGGGASGTLSGGSGQGGGGGSSFISGHNGCNAIDKFSTSSNIIHTGQSIHYSNYYFSNTIMIDGEGYNWTTSRGDYVGIPTYDGLSTMTANIGDGYAKITFLEER